MHIFVGGSLQDVDRDPELCRQFVSALGIEIMKQGHVLLNGCKSSLDQAVAVAAGEWLAHNGGDPKERVISYCLKADKPVHSLGTVRYSALLDWQINHPELEVPEQIEQAGATIFVAGSEGTFWARNWAHFARKPISPPSSGASRRSSRRACARASRDWWADMAGSAATTTRWKPPRGGRRARASPPGRAAP